MLQYPYPIRPTSMWGKTIRQLSERFSSCRTQQEYTQIGIRIFRFFRMEGSNRFPVWKRCKVKRWGLYRNRLQKPENGAGKAMQPPKIGFSKKKSTILPTKYSAFLVENTGIEPVTSCMPCKRSPEPRTHAPPHKGARMNNIWRWFASFFQKCNLTLESNQQ